MGTDDPLIGLAVEGPVQLEVFVLTFGSSGIELTGPCGPAAWYLETASADHPVDVVSRVVTTEVGAPDLVHSTSWRQGADGVILTFCVVVDRTVVASLETRDVRRVELARSAATTAPAAIEEGQVLEHALRHLAWLAQDDDEVRTILSHDWRAALGAYVPEPFRNL